ncbi:VOC family protein [Aquimarina gracilis]|uniref:VOC family protein n=1 Tax=Aquimarina gracilis TaxID=874422 RepID=A0ABU5ZW39_9FLAO|nr:VOC family protein [Aquimarina gracilis]MEB3346090.1 VOC family protein [Aquimarina gracilis]
MKIKELTLYTNHLDEQYDFYIKKIGLEMIHKSPERFELQVGTSILTFIKSNHCTPYHFAINIPSNKEIEALNWLKKKVTILKDNDDEIIDFTAWNAKAMYFYDYDKNIVEFIARKNLNSCSEEVFGSESLLEISEIGVATTSVIEKFDFLTKQISLSKYSGDLDRFCAIGSENGLFICIDKSKKDWYPNSDKAFSSEFDIAIEVEGKPLILEYKNDRFTLLNS